MLPTFGIEKIFNLPIKKVDFKVMLHHPINMPVITEPHKHDFFMLLIVSKGTGTHTIDFRDHPVKNRMVFFLAPGQAHQWQLSKNTQGFQVMFSPGFLPSPHATWSFFPPTGKPFLQLDTTQYQQLEQELIQLEKEANHPQLLSGNLLQHRLQIILLLLKRWYTHAFPEQAPAATNRLINRFLLLLEQHYATQSDVGFYAAQLHITPSYLNLVCKKASNRTAGEYIRERLLLEAKRMLTLTAVDVKEIAYGLGFNDTSYFSRFFRKHTGKTPLDFRKKI